MPKSSLGVVKTHAWSCGWPLWLRASFFFSINHLLVVPSWISLRQQAHLTKWFLIRLNTEISSGATEDLCSGMWSDIYPLSAPSEKVVDFGSVAAIGDPSKDWPDTATTFLRLLNDVRQDGHVTIFFFEVHSHGCSHDGHCILLASFRMITTDINYRWQASNGIKTLLFVLHYLHILLLDSICLTKYILFRYISYKLPIYVL